MSSKIEKAVNEILAWSRGEQALSDEILDRAWASVITTENRALIAQAIRQAENEAREEAAQMVEIIVEEMADGITDPTQLTLFKFLREATIEAFVPAIRSLATKDP